MNPNTFVLGAPKTGTTSMYEFLGAHPDIFVPQKKELHYFTQDALHRNVAGPRDLYALRATVRTEEEYLSYYARASTPVAADVSPSYLYYSEVAEAIRSFSPQSKAIAIVRDPIERSYSQYLHLRRSQRETLSFEDALDAEQARAAAGYGDMWRYTDTSRYAHRLRHYEAVFGRDNLLVIHAEQLAADSTAAMSRVYSFLGVGPYLLQRDVSRNRSGEARSKLFAKALGARHGKHLLKRMLPERLRGRIMLRLVELNTAEKIPLPTKTKERLAKVFESEARDLSDFLGQPVPWNWAHGR